MNWEKLAINKNLKLITCFIPGFTVLILIGLAHPPVVHAVENADFFGYKTKIISLLIVAFSVGLPTQEFFMALHMRILTVLFRAKRHLQLSPRRKKKGKDEEVEPWESQLWRTLAKQLFVFQSGEKLDAMNEDIFWKELWEALDNHYFCFLGGS